MGKVIPIEVTHSPQWRIHRFFHKHPFSSRLLAETIRKESAKVRVFFIEGSAQMKHDKARGLMKSREEGSLDEAILLLKKSIRLRRRAIAMMKRLGSDNLGLTKYYYDESILELKECVARKARLSSLCSVSAFRSESE